LSTEVEKPYWDDGTASERTMLAWHRTVIATVAIALIVLRAGIVGHQLALAIPVGALLLITAAAEWQFSLHILREHNRPFERGAILHDRVMVAVCTVTLVTAAAAAALSVMT
jgi:uncharacterized membrane protein YidH (DUF202 family)